MDEVSGSRVRLRRGLLALSNLLLLVAVVLAAYPFVTDLVTRSRQRALAAELPRVTPESVVSTGAPVTPLDWVGWEAQDKAYWDGLPLGGPMGKLKIEAMDLETTVVKGATTSTLRTGPGWIASTAMPGPEGTCGISGHRVTWLHPFKHIDKVKKGDIIEFRSPYRVYTYRAVRSFVVTPDRTDVLKDTGTPKLVLTACHPWYSARYRLVVEADLEKVTRVGPKGSE